MWPRGWEINPTNWPQSHQIYDNFGAILLLAPFATWKSIMPDSPFWMLEKAHAAFRNTALTYQLTHAVMNFE